MLLKINPNTFTFKGILYRVKTCSSDSKTLRSIYYPEIFSVVDFGSGLYLDKDINRFHRTIRKHDKHISNFTDPVPN